MCTTTAENQREEMDNCQRGEGLLRLCSSLLTEGNFLLHFSALTFSFLPRYGSMQHFEDFLLTISKLLRCEFYLSVVLRMVSGIKIRKPFSGNCSQGRHNQRKMQSGSEPQREKISFSEELLHCSGHFPCLLQMLSHCTSAVASFCFVIDAPTSLLRGRKLN